LTRPIGLLALQGDFEAHERAFADIGVPTIQVRNASQLDEISALVIPGGESTTMLKLIDIEGLHEPLQHFCQTKPIFGTCAGAILLAREVTHPAQPSFGAVDVTIERNAYGRQLQSTVAPVKLDDGGEIEGVFIRAPIIRRTGPGVRTLASYDGNPVLVEQGRHLIATFHPELTSDRTIHRLFADKVENAAAAA
jgi:5'-phosphate synthase pdxT subunit